MDARETISEGLRQMIEGEDYTPLERMVEDLTPEQACRKPASSPYSVATVAWHIWFWNNAWIIRIRSGDDPFCGHDPDASWPDIPEIQWETTRTRLLAGLRDATDLAQTAELDRESSGVTSGQRFVKITVHTAYHIGQIALIRQEVGLWPPAGGE